MKIGILAAVGAAIGSVLRYQVGQVIQTTNYPWGTFFVNVLGSFLIGLLLAIPYITKNEKLKVFLIPGLLGGFTTFSALAVESLQLGPQQALTYIFMTIFGGLAAAIIAFQLSRRLI